MDSRVLASASNSLNDSLFSSSPLINEGARNFFKLDFEPLSSFSNDPSAEMQGFCKTIKNSLRSLGAGKRDRLYDPHRGEQSVLNNFAKAP